MVGWILFFGMFITVILLCWYIKRLLNDVRKIGEGLRSVKFVIFDYVKHLQHLYSLQAYYGEPTIKDLIDHGKIVIKDLKQVQSLFNSIQDVEEIASEEIIDDELEDVETGEVQILGKINRKQ